MPWYAYMGSFVFRMVEWSASLALFLMPFSPVWSPFSCGSLGLCPTSYAYSFLLFHSETSPGNHFAISCTCPRNEERKDALLAVLYSLFFPPPLFFYWLDDRIRIHTLKNGMTPHIVRIDWHLHILFMLFFWKKTRSCFFSTPLIFFRFWRVEIF